MNLPSAIIALATTALIASGCGQQTPTSTGDEGSGWRIEPVSEAWETTPYQCGSEQSGDIPMVWIQEPLPEVRRITVCDQSTSPPRQMVLRVRADGAEAEGDEVPTASLVDSEILLTALAEPSKGPFVNADCEPAPRAAPFYLTLTDGAEVQPIVPLVACGTQSPRVRRIIARLIAENQ